MTGYEALIRARRCLKARVRQEYQLAKVSELQARTTDPIVAGRLERLYRRHWQEARRLWQRIQLDLEWATRNGHSDQAAGIHKALSPALSKARQVGLREAQRILWEQARTEATSGLSLPPGYAAVG